MSRRTDAGSGSGRSFPGFVGSLFRSALSDRQAASSSALLVFWRSLPGHLQNLEKWILTLAGFTKTLVRPGSMRGKQLRAGRFRKRACGDGRSQVAGGAWVARDSWFPGPGWEEAREENQRAVREPVGRIPVVPAGLRDWPLVHCPGVD